MEAFFSDKNVNMAALKQKAFNYRWAEQAEGVIPLTAADPDFPVSPHIRAAMKQYIEDGYFSYGPSEGLMAFRQSIANWYKRQHRVDCLPNHILPVNSAAYGLFVAMKSILSPGDQAIIPNPVDFLFRKSVENAGGKVLTSPINKETACFDLEDLESKINSKTKAIMLCNPNNPLGKSIPLHHLNDLIELAKKHNLWLVSDEIWADIYSGEQSPIYSIRDPKCVEYNKKIIVSGLSKNFGLAGLRIGYIIGPNEASYQMLLKNSAHQSTAFGLSPIAQVAGISALTECDSWLLDFRTHLDKMRLKTIDFIEASGFLIPTEADSTYLLFPKIKNNNSQATVDQILRLSKVALVPGGEQWFESESDGHLRICFASSDAILTEAFDRILAHKSAFL